VVDQHTACFAATRGVSCEQFGGLKVRISRLGTLSLSDNKMVTMDELGKSCKIDEELYVKSGMTHSLRYCNLILSRLCANRYQYSR
jgi:hypothetical protein